MRVSPFLLFLAVCLFGSALGDKSYEGNYDLLSPYLPHVDQHAPVRSKQELLEVMQLHDKRSTTSYEVIDAAGGNVPNSVANVRHYRLEETVNNRFISGHLWVLDNPIGHFNILPPVGGCGGNRQTVTTSARAGGCEVATNAGYFNTHNGNCIGNLVSQGKVLQNPGYSNAQFGITKDGKLVTGYVTKEDVGSGTTTQFEHLVAGVLWILRNGQVYVDQSLRIENMTVQETGNGFATIISARSSVGHDAQGRIMILNIDGKSYQRGINLYDMAALFKSLGALNAINLDGGGSVNVAQNATIVNYPSDKCNVKVGSIDTYCEREVTSITCIRHNYEWSVQK